MMKVKRDQARLCLRVRDLFQKGVLVLDEVDLLLHPLKSELNWPLGLKQELDHTLRRAEHATEKLAAGLRWRLPSTSSTRSSSRRGSSA